MFKKHTARIDTVAWSPDSHHFATGSLDQTIIIWSIEDFQTLTPNVLVIKRKYNVCLVPANSSLNEYKVCVRFCVCL